jgi:hypothetical protein
MKHKIADIGENIIEAVLKFISEKRFSTINNKYSVDDGNEI